DGTRIAFSAQKDPDLISGDTSDLYVINLNDKAVKRIVSTPGPDRNPHWSPDGKKIAFETAAGSQYFFYTNSRIGVVTADGGAGQETDGDGRATQRVRAGPPRSGVVEVGGRNDD